MAPGAVSISWSLLDVAEEVSATSSFQSVLFDGPVPDTPKAATASSDAYADLHLADIVSSIVAGRDEYDLAPLFAAPLPDEAAIGYRHEVFRDLEDDAVIGLIRAFGEEMRVVRRRLSGAHNVHYRYEQERWFLDAAISYTDAVGKLSEALAEVGLRSRGLTAFRDFLAGYVASDGFATLAADTERVETLLSDVRYRLRIRGGKVIVTPYVPEPDYGAEVLAHFEKFRQGASKSYTFPIDRQISMNHVEAAILEGVSRQNPDAFAALDAFCADHAEFLDPTVTRFDREVQFYVAYLDHIRRFRQAGLPFCYPDVHRERTVDCRRTFDLALAATLGDDLGGIVANDLVLADGERIVVVSGPNQGGKTTFARTIGQVHHLARIGAPVPGTAARLPLVDRIFTHFERQEQVEDLSSKLEDDLRRIHAVLDAATADSLLILNESFSSTTVSDQLFIGQRVMRGIIDRGPVCIVVTFLDELASLDPTVVSMVSTVDPEEPARRTFEIVRRPADGLAYALAIAEKHHLTYPSLKARLPR